jgi:two-component system cell cycle response regulator
VNAAKKDDKSKVRRILVVEDNTDQVHTLVYLLKDMGHEVDYAINGTVAWDMARRMRPQVVMLDIALPDVSGFDLIPRLRAQPELSKSYVIAVTGLPLTRAEVLARGFDDFVGKPIEFRFLEAALHRNAQPGFE